MHRSVWLLAAVAAVTGACLAFPALAGATVFSNPAPITIPSLGTATPYPSTIAVGGLSGTITKVTATLIGFSHAFPSDVGVLLVGPTGANVVLMDGPDGGNTANNLTFTFDDAGASSLPCSNVALATGTYKPNACKTDVFSAPAPPGPHGSQLATFNGTNPNGTWSLYVQDFEDAASGSISGGWSLDITIQPLAVSVFSLKATRSQKGVVVRWRTGTEADTLGYNLYRQQGNRRVRVNRRLLPALGGVSGRSYSYLDRRAPRHRAVRYWLQDVSVSGARAWHGPVRVSSA